MSINTPEDVSVTRKLIAAVQGLRLRWEDLKMDNRHAVILVRAAGHYVTFSEDADLIANIVPKKIVDYFPLPKLNGCYLPNAANRDKVIDIITIKKALVISEDVLSSE